MTVTDEIIRGSVTVEAVGKSGTGGVKFRGVAYQGGVLRVAGFSGGIVVDLEGIQIPSSVPVASDHSSSLESRLGTLSGSVAGSELVVQGTIVPGTPPADRAIALLRNGGLSLSIGARPLRIEFVEAGETVSVNGQEFAGPIDIARESELFEVSGVGIGADRDAVAVAAHAINHKGTGRMTVTNKDSQAVLAERERVTDINGAFAGLGEQGRAEADRLIESGASVSEANRTALEMLKASRPNVNAIRGDAAADASDSDVLAAATMLHAGIKAEDHFKPEVCEKAESLGVHSLVDLCATAIRTTGGHMPNNRNEMIRAAFSTTSLPIALDSSVNKVALGAFQTAPEPWMAIARKTPLSNFREAKFLRLDDDLELEVVAKDGEIKHGELGESDAGIKLDTYAKIIALTRQSIINDDVSIFADIPQRMGREATRKIGDLFTSTLQAGVGSFFTSGNGNYLTGTGSSLSVDSLTDAVKNLRRQIDSSGRPIGLQPKYLLVSPELETHARAILSSAELKIDAIPNTPVGTAAPTGNPLRNVAELHVEARLNATQWALFSMPSDNAIAVGTLNGLLGPTIESEDADFSNLGRRWRVFMDFGVARVEHRAAVWSDGQQV